MRQWRRQAADFQSLAMDSALSSLAGGNSGFGGAGGLGGGQGNGETFKLPMNGRDGGTTES